MTDDAPRTPGHDREPDPDRTGEDADARAEPEVEPGTDSGAGASESPHLGERLTQQIAAQWALIRAEREAERDAEREAERRRTDIGAGRSNFSRAQVPHALDLAAAWSWRFLVIVAASFLIAWTLARFCPSWSCQEESSVSPEWSAIWCRSWPSVTWLLRCG